MTPKSSADQAPRGTPVARTMNEEMFRTILVRNLILPVVLALVSAFAAATLIFYLFSITKSLAQSNQTISQTNKVLKLYIDAESDLPQKSGHQEWSFLV